MGTRTLILALVSAVMLSACFGQPSDEEVKAHKNAQEDYCDDLQDDMRAADRDGNTLRAAQRRDEYQRNCLSDYR